MAMMMTGRVLLVCALCVLWCGAGGRCDGGETAGSGSGGGPPPESKEIETSPQVKQELKDEARSVKGKKPPTSSEDEVEEDEKEDNDDDDDDEPEEEKEKSKEKEDAQQTRKSKSSSKEVAPLTIPKASGLSEAGGGSPSGVDGVGSSESSGGSEDLNLEVSAPVVNFPPLLPNAAAGGLQNTDGALSSQKNNFSETGVHSGTTPPAPSLPKSQAPAITKPEAEEQSSTEQDTEDSPDTEEVTTGKENVQNTVETGIPSRSSSAASKPPVQLTTPILTQSPAVALPERSALAPSEKKSTAPSFSAGEGSRRATNVAQNSKEEKNEKLPSENETESKAVEQPSGDDLAEQDSPARTTASPIPASGSAEAQRNADADNSNAQALKYEGTNKNSETGYTNLASTAGDAATQTEKALADAKANDTVTPGDGDGSTAVSHTTSPLLLLLFVTCAAAAVVVAA
ncbi:Mucin-associated surface protein (MASP) [Trypanosoma cruzi]|uniref:Mucin-associated surface protein (MASP), putative n=2 Tax=Trypanosoma cruzi TaxID=5693 RepID=Q4DKW6_TRYCC|nr:mucin-associated surface protein (MASP), putative [Trypanosoma cruzi]EAN93161.1 mucin-associated surface protein (MASP), putative [Trypanosoma cruzi]PWV09756.1 Mucin-associated surface protein (MASP) [Trypanosoma cruzi]|eukprot:XP_815012.1 mucin-associated surface protein (MASP) [Trypanosoma cruzi strain CL Brener]